MPNAVLNGRSFSMIFGGVSLRSCDSCEQLASRSRNYFSKVLATLIRPADYDLRRSGRRSPSKAGRPRRAQEESSTMPRTQAAAKTDSVKTVIRGACPHDCPDTCAVLVTVEDGRAIEVRGDPEHP